MLIETIQQALEEMAKRCAEQAERLAGMEKLPDRAGARLLVEVEKVEKAGAAVDRHLKSLASEQRSDGNHKKPR